MKLVRNILVIVVLMAGVVLCFVNAQAVTVDYLLGEIEISLIFVLIIALVLGFSLAYLAMLPRIVARRSELQKVRRQLHEAEQEVRNLRNLPIQDA